MKELKIYEITFGGERYWVAARTTIEALRIMISTIGVNFYDFGDDDEIEVLQPEEWPNRNIVDPDTDLEENEESEVIMQAAWEAVNRKFWDESKKSE